MSFLFSFLPFGLVPYSILNEIHNQESLSPLKSGITKLKIPISIRKVPVIANLLYNSLLGAIQIDISIKSVAIYIDSSAIVYLNYYSLSSEIYLISDKGTFRFPSLPPVTHAMLSFEYNDHKPLSQIYKIGDKMIPSKKPKTSCPCRYLDIPS